MDNVGLAIGDEIEYTMLSRREVGYLHDKTVSREYPDLNIWRQYLLYTKN